MTPLITPVDLLATQLKLDTLNMLGSLLLGFALIAVLIWVYFELSSPASLCILEQSGYRTGKPMSACVAGSSIIVLLIVFSSIFLYGESAETAKELAKKQLGSNYKYHVISITTSGGAGQAIVTAYTPNEIINVQVQW